MAIAKQPKPEEILMCNTSNIDSMRHGRPQTVMFEPGQIVAGQVVPNGVIVTLGGTKETSEKLEMDHVHAIEIVKSEAADVKGKFIVVSPEINVEQYRRIDNSIANHVLVANETYTAYELAKLDRIEYSEAYFAENTNFEDENLVEAALDLNGKLTLVAAGAGCFKVVSKRPQRLPLMMAHNADRAGLGGQILMIKLEVK